jgi:hypothetical protein
MRKLLFFVLLLVSPSLLASNKIAVSQGVSSPSSTSTINFSNGFTIENPVGVLYQDGIRLTGQFTNGNSTSIGGEAGIGNQGFGAAVGFTSFDCDGCDSRASLAVAGEFRGIGFGLRFGENLYGAGVIVNPGGQHRIGFVADVNDGNDLTVTSFGAGYSYVSKSFSFSVDASNATFDSDAIEDTLILLTPGLSFHIDFISFTVSYDIRINDDNDTSSDNDLWFGVGINTSQSWNVMVYSEYANDLAVAASFYF